MDVLNSIPDWLANAFFAFLGFFGKLLFDNFKAQRKNRKDVFDEMYKLKTLLSESESIFHDQNYKAKQLMKLLTSRIPQETPNSLGFDETFHRLYEKFTPEERELFSLIRSTTMNSLKRVNEEMMVWLKKNEIYKLNNLSDSKWAILEAQLNLLRTHLNQWHDKFNAFMNDERRCLVYMADEKRQGIRFPQELEPALDQILAHQKH
ncbi:hypothetical protein [Larkinella soli]|uniref:hypothetical protein n=1 Tax=Larkinella soli TaxID=1770527 RepID=UPI000FFB6C9F|nr:hypothetical protein [Larkinella soli]